ncbi:MarR family winged helix-turn-helix transcriptional regulator [Kitasatospora sp. LaBMicrA B282]|uniref:MarR family winged helix-turn-helix transcriptional regulator n=1 Tax=Kitasatospora sp. LaBMicrA B282 TaxID=3420949 RepID=UPI003D0FBCF8
MTRTTPPTDAIEATTAVTATEPTTAADTARLMDRLARAADCSYRNLAAAAARQDLTFMQGKILSLLHQPLPMRTLAGLLGCDASNVTGLVDRLESRGLVRREPDPADRRVKNVLLTDAGAAADRQIRAAEAAGLPGLAQLDATERAALLELLDRVFPATGGTPEGAACRAG